VKPQDHHPQSVPKQAKETTKAKPKRNKHRLLTRKTKKQETQNGNHVGEEGCRGKKIGARGIR
jgi:hypothetical protein